MPKRIIDVGLLEYHRYFASVAYLLPSLGQIHESTVMINPHHPTKIILIDRCASTFLKKTLSEVGFDIIQDNEIQDTPINDVSTFIRNPSDRYFSCLVRNSVHLFNFFGITLTEKIIEKSLSSNQFILSDHCCPQHLFLDVFTNLQKINYFSTDRNIQTQLKYYLNIDITDNEKIHTTDNYKSQYPYLIDMCEILFNKYCIDNKELYNLYKKDWDLYEYANNQ